MASGARPTVSPVATRNHGELVAQASHEVRSLLTRVTGYLELLGDEDPGPLNAEQHEMVEVAAHASQDLLSLGEDLVERLRGARPVAEDQPQAPAARDEATRRRAVNALEAAMAAIDAGDADVDVIAQREGTDVIVVVRRSPREPNDSREK